MHYIHVTDLFTQRPDDIQQLNVHSVIYDNVFKDVQSMETLSGTICNWDCLMLCLDHFMNVDVFMV